MSTCNHGETHRGRQRHIKRKAASKGQNMTDKHAREKEKKGEKASCKKEGAACAPVTSHINPSQGATATRESHVH